MTSDGLDDLKHQIDRLLTALGSEYVWLTSNPDVPDAEVRAMIIEQLEAIGTPLEVIQRAAAKRKIKR